MNRARFAEEPDKVRRLARDMRIRAAELEVAAYDSELLDETIAQIRVTSGFTLLA